jgi:cobalamin biosynthesis protein CobW
MKKIPATILTGFLGAGKTTTIRHLLENAGGRRIALVINEFGDLGVDGELANGCICCTVADDFLPTIRALLARETPPDHIVIETSGLALPKPLVKAFAWPEVRTRVTVDGVVALVDAPAVAAGRFAGDPDAVQAQRAADANLDHESPLEELFEEQLACADLVVLNKVDLLDAADLPAIEAAARRDMRPGVKLLHARQGAVDPAVLLGLSAAAEDDLASRPSHHEDHDEHDHEDFASFAVDLGEAASPQDLVRRLQPTIDAHDIYRVKGFAAVAGKPMRLVVQGVGPRIETYYDRDWRDDETRGSRLVVIGSRDMDRAAIAGALAASEREPA